MRLENARLCLDCEEIHEEQECPACGSEAFGFLTRWIKATREPGENPSRAPRPLPGRTTNGPPPPRATAASEQVDAWRRIVEGNPEPSRARVMARSILGLTAMGLAGWAWSRKGKEDEGTLSNDE